MGCHVGSGTGEVLGESGLDRTKTGRQLQDSATVDITWEHSSGNCQATCRNIRQRPINGGCPSRALCRSTDNHAYAGDFGHIPELFFGCTCFNPKGPLLLCFCKEVLLQCWAENTKTQCKDFLLILLSTNSSSRTSLLLYWDSERIGLEFIFL